jgi:hypothetical protein
VESFLLVNDHIISHSPSCIIVYKICVTSHSPSCIIVCKTCVISHSHSWRVHAAVVNMQVSSLHKSKVTKDSGEIMVKLGVRDLNHTSGHIDCAAHPFRGVLSED